MTDGKEEKGVTIGTWWYLKEGKQVTAQLPELLCWNLVAQGVLEVQREKSPVKSEGEILYVRPGLNFSSALSPMEEIFRLPFQTRVVRRLKWINYTRQVLNILKSYAALEKEYILPELKEKGLLNSSWWDILRGERRIKWREEDFVAFEVQANSAWKQKELNLPYLGDSDWKIP